MEIGEVIGARLAGNGRRPSDQVGSSAGAVARSLLHMGILKRGFNRTTPLYLKLIVWRPRRTRTPKYAIASAINIYAPLMAARMRIYAAS